MAIRDKTTLKTFFQTGDVPTQAQFVDLIDSITIEGAPVVGGDSSESFKYASYQTGSMPFPIEFFVGWSDFGNGNDDTTWSIQFNHDGVAGYPKYGKNIEVFFDTGTQRLIEENTDYTSIDRSVIYRPKTFNVDIDTHLASQVWTVGSYTVKSRLDEVALISANTTTSQIQVGGSIILTNRTGSSTGLGITGPIGGGSALSLYPSSVAADAAVISIAGPSLTGDYYALSATASPTGVFGTIFRNTAGEVREMLWSGSGKDAFFRTLGGATDCSFGVDASAASFVIDFGDTLGGNPALSINASTKAFKVVGAFAANNKTPSTPALTSSTTLAQLMQALEDIGLIDYTP